jgi:uncharacterized protein (DUF1499 family)
MKFMSDIERPSPTSARVVRDYGTSPEDLQAIVRRVVEGLSRWRLESIGDDGLEITRRTSILRFTDDVAVRVDARDDGSRLEATSRSRVGKGDLGQNPRNLRELLDNLEQALEAGDA